jgi:hypothetical protein
MFERLLAYVPFQVIMRRAKRKLELTYNVIGRDDVDLEAHGPATGGSNDMETVDDSALGNIVNAALAQRGKSGSDLSSSTEFGNVGLVTLDSQEDQAENFYNYEGKDFTKVRICTGFTHV